MREVPWSSPEAEGQWVAGPAGIAVLGGRDLTDRHFAEL